ncbi:MBL fold metallo-hydrolase [Streptomyces sp. TLI_105]|uniref:MBL fold metallo-hydrolase n=1 Tax=Streptomyces sp. TLI_105 TaxID=1881019 RepID=UPI00089D9B70|nr:MBL fold metallo-hydrolase [Streptomyces sp. TLI_105]SED01323.1 Metallo-beta-lactamase superfamily protein [Streptomyces sp. TLI_105]
MDTHKVGSDTTVLADSLEAPGVGHIPVNAYVLTAAEPVVVDTGLSLADRNFVNTLGSVVDPADILWIWLTHPDRDHTGGIFDLLVAAPRAKVVTTFLGAGIMTTERPLPMERVYFLNPGQSLDVGDRMLHAFRPPLFDNPATVGFYDEKTRICFSSDCFGGPMPTVELAESGHANDLKPEELRRAQLVWATLDSPWVHIVDPAKYRATIDPLRDMAPEIVLSTHLPPAVRMTTSMIDTITMAPDADPFVGPDQAALEQMLASFEPGGLPAAT